MDVLLIAVLVAAVAVVAIVVGLYERELRHMAHFLHQREQGSNERISVEFATRGIREVASAMNKELDALRDARIEQEKHQAAFKQDLASLSHDIRTPWRVLRVICSCMSVHTTPVNSNVALKKPLRVWALCAI